MPPFSLKSPPKKNKKEKCHGSSRPLSPVATTQGEQQNAAKACPGSMKTFREDGQGSGGAAADLKACRCATSIEQEEASRLPRVERRF